MHAYDMGSGFKEQVWYVVRHGGTWAVDPDGFLLRGFLLDFVVFVLGNWSLRTGTPPALEGTSFPPLVTAVLITPKGAQSPDSRCIRVIGALAYFLPPETI